MYLLPSGASGFYALLTRRYLVAAGLALFTLWIITSRTPDINALRDYVHNNGNNKDKNLFGGGGDKWLGSQDKFVARAVDRGIYTEAYNGSAVRDVCGRAQWREGLVVSCDKIAGGIGNLKMRLLGCARYAIEAGATLVTPVIHPRQAYKLMEESFGWDVDLPLDYMFDTQHFYDTLQADCPQLRIVNESDPALRIPPKSEALPLDPKALQPTKWAYVLLSPELWRPSLEVWLAEFVVKPRGGGGAISAADPVRLSFNDGVQFSWPTAHDGPDFKRDWGLAARFPRPVRALAGRVLYRLYQATGCRQDPALVSRGCFLGVHVRTEQDAAVEHWDSYETQLAHVREQLLTHQLPVLYVATGKRSDVERLRRDVADIRVVVGGGGGGGGGGGDDDDDPTNPALAAAPALSPVRVLEKWDLVDDEDLMRMDELTWDQAAVVDFEVMLRASRFAGIWESSWTWMIALTRHLHVPAMDPYQGLATYEDGLSIIYGEKGAQPMIDPAIYL